MAPITSGTPFGPLTWRGQDSHDIITVAGFRYERGAVDNLIVKCCLNAHPNHHSSIPMKYEHPILIKYDFVFDVIGEIIIGKYFASNSRCLIIRHDHPITTDKTIMEHALLSTNKADPLIIEDDVAFQERITIMPNVTKIHKGSLLLPNSTLTRNTTCKYGVWGGTPAKLIRLRETNGKIPHV